MSFNWKIIPIQFDLLFYYLGPVDDHEEVTAYFTGVINNQEVGFNMIV